MKRRQGHTLVEMIAAMAAGAVLSAVAIALIVILLRSAGVARDHIRKSAVESRLAEQFRRDVHAADSIDIEDSGLAWTLTLGPKHTVDYRIDANWLERSEKGDPDIARRETYVLPPDHTATLQMPEPPIVTLSIVPTSTTIDAKSRSSVRFDAIMAADRRYGEPPDTDNKEDTDG